MKLAIMKLVAFKLMILVLVAISLLQVAVVYVNAEGGTSSYTGGYKSASSLLDESKRSEILNQYYNTFKKPFNTTNSNIVGGEPAEDSEFPWFGRTEIFFTDGFSYVLGSCGASLIYRDVAVTAAHCFVKTYVKYPGFAWEITFNLGANNYDGSDGTPINVIDVVWPSDYDANAIGVNDIAYYILETPTDIDPILYNINPAFPTPGTIGTAVGFGDTTTNGEQSDFLLKVDLPSISVEDCENVYGSIADSVTCTFDPNRQKSTCDGDSGGPIISQDGTLFGTTSFGGASTCPGRPQGFTRTSYYADFTPRVICDYSSSPPVGCEGFPPPAPPSCGLFGLSIFCPFSFGGIIGRLLRAIFGS